MKKFVTLLISVGLVASSVFAVNAQENGDAYDPLRTITGGQGNVVEYVVEGGNAERNSYIAISPGAVTSSGQSRVWQWCGSLSDQICNPQNSPTRMLAKHILPPCVDLQAENCIESVEIAKDSNYVQAKLIRNTQGLTFQPDTSVNFIGGSTISLWDAPGVAAAGGRTTYAVMPRLESFYQNGKFIISSFYAEVVPYREEVGSQFAATKVNPDPNATAEYRYTGGRYGQVCVYVEDGKCGVAQDFAPDTRIRLKIRLTKSIGGWFDGRLKDPKLDITNFSATSSLVTVDASPVSVPRLATVVAKSTMTEFEKVMYTNMGYWPTVDDGNGSGAQAGEPQDSFPFIDYYRQKVHDTAVAVNSFWNYRTTAWGSGSNCLQDKSKLLGIVTSNAMAYDGQSPSFENDTLNYRVSGLHFMPDGKTPVQGTYNLVLRSEVARCLYGLTPAPVKATISISGGSDAVVATTSMNESNGWLSLSAAGFTFSEKKINVKLTQDAPVVVPAPAPSVAPTTASVTPVKPVVKQMTITCVKGKTSKKVTAVKPTCPKGYIKK